jgi:hypothetical protein
MKEIINIEELRKTHEDSMNILKPHFKHLSMYFFGRFYEVIPAQLPIKILSEELGTAYLKWDKENGGNLCIEINERGHSSAIDLETSIVHETGHYLHLLKNPRQFYTCTYGQKELIAIASCFIYFSEKGKFPEFKEYVGKIYDPVKTGIAYYREKACLEMIKEGRTPKDILKKALEGNSEIFEVYEQVCNEIDEKGAKILRNSRLLRIA